jgi:hypothetical protein
VELKADLLADGGGEPAGASNQQSFDFGELSEAA